MTTVSHTCSLKEKKMIHKLSKKEIELEISPNQITYKVKGITF